MRTTKLILALSFLFFSAAQAWAAELTWTSQPDDVTVECGQSTDPGDTGQATATTNGEACTVTVTYSDSEQGQCGNTKVITRTWTATDDCDPPSPEITHVQTITVEDTTAPQIEAPNNVTVELGEGTDPGDTGQATGTDTCGSVSISHSDATTPGCGNTGTITRTWTATDACGNTSNAQQIITVEDTTAPHFTAFPPNVTVPYGGSTDPTVTGRPTATDEGGDVTLTYSDEFDQESCGGGGVISRTWTATDECGNSNSRVQTLTVADNNDLTWESAYEFFRYSVESNGGMFFRSPTDFNPNGSASALSTNLQDGGGTYSDTVASTNSPFPLAGLFTMTAGAQGTGTMGSPDNGLKVKGYARTVLNGFNPATQGVQVDQNVLSWVSRKFSVSSTGAYNLEASLNGPVSFHLFGTPGTNFYSAYALNGRAIVDAFKIGTDGSLIALPWEWTIFLNGGTRSGSTQVVLAPQTSQGESIVYRLRVILEINTHLQNLYLSGNNPVIATGSGFTEPFQIGTAGTPMELEAALCYVPGTPPLQISIQPKSVQCDQPFDPGSTGYPVAIGGCGGPYTSNFTDGAWNAGACPNTGYFIRTWTVRDACQNTISATQRIDVRDNLPPAFTYVPADLTVACGAITDPSATGGEATATDACGTVTISHSDAITAACGNTRIIRRTWSAMDQCGNTATQVQTITVQDNTPPQFVSVPPETTVSCGGSTDPSVTGQATASDACGSVAVTHSDSLAQTCGGAGVVTRTWTATDACGNSVTATQRINLVDGTAPTWTYAPSSIVMECTGSTDPSVTGQATASDTCSAVTVTHSDSFAPSCGGSGVLTRVWTATDACGNTNTHTQVITLHDDTAPYFVSFPPNVTVPPGGSTDPSVTGSASAGDVCSGVTVSHADVSGPGPGGSIVLTRTWTATDACQNSVSRAQRIVIGELPVGLPGPMILLLEK